MVSWSTLRPLFLRPLKVTNAVNRYMSGDHRVFPYGPSRWQWTKFKDYVHFYVCLGVIPLTIITVGANIFIGPATLTEIPPDYQPKHWEYHRSPISRFIARYILSDPQQEYEKFLHHLYEENERKIIRELESEVKLKISQRSDYQAYYYKPVFSKYHRISRESADELEKIRGD